MKISFIPSLEHLCCMKIMPSLFEEVLPLIEVCCLRTSRLLQNNSLALQMDPDNTYNMIYKCISDRLKVLISCTPLQKKLQSFIAPLFCEIDDWLKFCENTWSSYDHTLFIILKSVSQCWSPNGSIDREKSAKILVKNSDASTTCRFLFACTFCLLDDVLEIWKIVPTITKLYLEHNAGLFATLWIEWLESTSTKDWQSFIQWALESEMWNKNVYVMKHVFKTLNSLEKSQYLSYALTKREVSSDIMCFGLSLMTRDEQELIFKKSPVEVFKCITSWPMRSSFFDAVDILMPFLTCDVFCDILNTLLQQIKIQKRDFDELLVIMKKFWAESPLLFKNFARNNSCISEPLQIVLDYNFTEAFPTQKFFDSLNNDIWSLTPFII